MRLSGQFSIMTEKYVTIHAGWLIDGSGQAAKSRMKIGLQNGIIHSIGKQKRPLTREPEAAGALWDLSDCTLLPALIDCHTHLALPETPGRQKSSTGSAKDEHDVRECIIKRLDHYLATGIMAVRDGGDREGKSLLCKTDPFIKAHPVGVRVAGAARHRAGRYGDLIGSALMSDQTLAEDIETQTGDVDHIKIVNSGLNSLYVFGKETAPQFGLDELTAAISAARQRGYKTMVHANGQIPVKTALDAGCDSIEHGFFMGRENINRLADSRTIWVPTVFTMQALKHRMRRAREAVDVVRQNLDHQLEQIQIARQQGVRVALGTDAGSSGVAYGQSVINEMGLYLDAGYTIEEVIACATHVGAVLINQPRCGQIKPDMLANMVAVKGEPSQLPHSLRKIKTIIYKGNLINTAYKMAKQK
jgi:imidazolonepropionase-like amidohydrolase